MRPPSIPPLKTFFFTRPHFLKGGHFLSNPCITMVKTSSSYVSKLVVPLLQHGLTFFHLPPLCRGINLLGPPSPPPPLPILNGLSLRRTDVMLSRTSNMTHRPHGIHRPHAKHVPTGTCPLFYTPTQYRLFIHSICTLSDKDTFAYRKMVLYINLLYSR